jgi:Zn-dependent peptidase ImmA (M78 family)
MITIPTKVKHLVKKHGTRDPEKIAAYLGIKVKYEDLADNTKGFYINLIRNKFIVINSNSTEKYRKIIIAHELGHALLHNNKSTCLIREYTLFPRGKIENEANIFAAELLINENCIDKYSIENMSINQLSCYFEVPERLIMYKFFE